MSLFRRCKTWWVSYTTPSGQRVRCSAETTEKRKAQQYHDKLKAEAWRVFKLGERPRYTWQEAVIRYLKEKVHKASIKEDRWNLRWLDPYLGKLYLDEVTRDLVDQVKQARLAEGVANASVNRILEVLRAILRMAEREWEWIERAPVIRLLPEPKRRIRWLNRDEADRLVSSLPEHLAEMARFSLSTGLRQRNVADLQWSQVDLKRRLAWIHPDQAKARKAIGVPLNGEAMLVLRRLEGKHPTHVFTYRGKPIRQVNTKAWKSALKRAGIVDFRWHDLRHTWASWHVQMGTPLAVLQELGGWESELMVRRYAHLSTEHLAPYAEKISRPRALDAPHPVGSKIALLRPGN